MNVTYRPFRNSDPPALVRIWNESMTGRGSAYLQGTAPFEQYVLAKQYFDPNGLIVAVADGEVAGFAHAGFGPADDGRDVSTEVGVICMVVVKPDKRRGQVGSELLRRSEGFLRSLGAKTVYCGSMQPLYPFYFGLYGGSEMPGVLASDPTVAPFLKANGYTVTETCLVFERFLEEPPKVTDVRFVQHRRQHDFEMGNRPSTGTWFRESVLSPVEAWRFQLVEKVTRTVAASAVAWEMDQYAWRRHHQSAGIIDVEVHPDRQGKGLGKFLLYRVLCYLHEQFFTRVEIQTMSQNNRARNLYLSLGFQQVDEGFVYLAPERA